MKKEYIVFVFSVIIVLLLSCNNPNSNARPSTGSSETANLVDKGGHDVSEEFREGANLVASNDCLTCHKVRDTSIGPSFTSIANRYDNIEANVSKLLVSVQRGSTGQWGGVAMTPHPNLTPQDGQKMLRYILSNRTR